MRSPGAGRCKMVALRSLCFLGLLQFGASYDYVKWDAEPEIDMTKDPEIARTVYFIHMRKVRATT